MYTLLCLKTDVMFISFAKKCFRFLFESFIVITKNNSHWHVHSPLNYSLRDCMPVQLSHFPSNFLWTVQLFNLEYAQFSFWENHPNTLGCRPNLTTGDFRATSSKEAGVGHLLYPQYKERNVFIWLGIFLLSLFSFSCQALVFFLGTVKFKYRHCTGCTSTVNWWC